MKRGALFAILSRHPTLEVLHLCSPYYTYAPLAPAVLKSRIQALVNMLKVNISIHTIHLESRDSDRSSMIPYLETNRLRPRIRAIQKARPITYRAKVLGRALLSARTDVNSFWMLLSGNADVASPLIARTTSAANLPTPATVTAANATSNAAAVAATAAVTVTATPVAWTTGAFAVMSLLLLLVRSARHVLSPTMDLSNHLLLNIIS
jgi:hypothetical protein